MQRTRLMGILALGVCVLWACASARAQQQEAELRENADEREDVPGDFRGSRVTDWFRYWLRYTSLPRAVEMFDILGDERVREELKISDDQEGQIRALRDSMRERPRHFPLPFQEFKKLSGEDREAWTTRLRTEHESRRVEARKRAKAELASILKPEQYERFREINIQREGTYALLDEEVAHKLELTPEQQASIVAAVNDCQERGLESIRGLSASEDGNSDRETVQESLMQLQKEVNERLRSILTAEQKDAFEAMKGQPFTRAGGSWFTQDRRQATSTDREPRISDLAARVANLEKRVEELEEALVRTRRSSSDRPRRDSDEPKAEDEKAASVSAQEIKVFSLENARAEAIVPTVLPLFQRQSLPRGFGAAATYSLLMTADSRTNTVIARGPKEELEVLEAVLMRLDQKPE